MGGAGAPTETLIRVLGRVELDDAEADGALGGGQAREFLALLVARRRSPITTTGVVDAIWPDDPPATATTIVHGLVRRVRAALGAESIAHDDDGYRLTLSDEAVDLWRLDAALADGDTVSARRLWREPAFGRYAARAWARDAVGDVASSLRVDFDSPGALRLRRRVPVTRLVGRRRELHAVAAACRRTRLVSVVGLGGVGKSRLALEAIRHLDVGDAVYVDIAAASGPAASRVTAELGQVMTGRSDTDLRAIASLIGRDPRLLVLDGCEHDVEGSATVVEYLLGHCPELRVIATSRRTLGVPGEHVVPLLPFGDPGNPLGDAVELLLDRAQGMGLTTTAADRARAAEICDACAGVPLAIELSAARLAFGTSTHAVGGDDATPERTVTAAVVDAIGRLSESTSIVARRASLLVGGFTPRVAGALHPSESVAVGSLQELTASGLVVAETLGAGRRLRFLDGARDALQARATDDDRSLVHDAVTDMFTRVRPDLTRPVSAQALVEATGELTNGDAVLGHLVDAGDVDAALALATTMADTWGEDGQWTYGTDRLTSLLDGGAGDGDPLARARAVRALATVTATYDGVRRLADRLESAADAARHADDAPLLGHLLLHLTNAYGYGGRPDLAAEPLAEMRDLGERSDIEIIRLGARSLTGASHLLTGEPGRAEPILIEVATRMLELGGLSDSARLHRLASLACRGHGDQARARELLETAAQLAADGHARGTLATIRTDLADLLVDVDHPDAGTALETALGAVLAVGNQRAAGIIRTRLGDRNVDAPTIALGVVDLWHTDRRLAAASLAVLLEHVAPTQRLHRVARRVIGPLTRDWGTPLTPADAARVARYVDGDEDAAAADEVLALVTALATTA